MYHAFLANDGFENYILNDELSSDWEKLRELSNHVGFKHYAPQKNYNEAERRLNKALIRTNKNMEGKTWNLDARGVCIYDSMPKRRSKVKYKNIESELTISTIPEIRDVVQLGMYYNDAFEYYVFYSVKHCLDAKDNPVAEIWYKVVFSKQISIISTDLYGIMVSANRFPGHTIFTPSLPVAMAFERGWVIDWLRNNTQVEKLETWRYVYGELSKRKLNCKVAYRKPQIDEEYPLIEDYLEYLIFIRYYRQLEYANPSYYDKPYRKYKIDEYKVRQPYAWTVKELP